MTQFFDAFISYGRADSKAFATKLYNCLNEAGVSIWFDQNDIPLGVDFQNQIDDGIEKAHNFLFIISPHSVNSVYCWKEIDLAIQYNKRIIPILHVESITEEIWQNRHPNGTQQQWETYKKNGLHTSFQNMHPVIHKINWVYFREEHDNFDESFKGLLTVIHRHADYVQKHTQFLTKALEWERNQKQTQFLLIEEERKAAQTWLKIRFKETQPPCIPTDLHCEFICESQKNADNLLTQVFLSYDTEDRESMEKIRRTLMREGFTVWTNNTDIKTGTEFQEEINRGVEGADNVLYLISVDSLKSKYCQQEITRAFFYNKRIIPIRVKLIAVETIPEPIQSLQFIDLIQINNEPEYRSKIDKLLNLLYQDAAYYKQHKILLVKALKWERQNRNPSILLRGYNLKQAQAWLTIKNQSTLHSPLPIHEEFINESLQQPPDLSIDVFISYSRADSDFARMLNEALQIQGKTTWFDQESIASGANFQQEIYHGIENSDNFLFIISPQSIHSPYCAEEVEYAQTLNKRFVSILYQPVSTHELHPALANVQWIDFHQKLGEFYTYFSELVRTLDTDRDHVKNHTKWSQRSIEWDQNSRDSSFLLRGTHLQEAQKWLQEWLMTGALKQPEPTTLQTEYLIESYKVETTQIKAEKARQQAELDRQKAQIKFQRIALGSISLALLIAVGLGIAAYREYRQAAIQELDAHTLSSEALFSANQRLDALITALRARQQLQQIGRVPTKTQVQVESVLRQAIYGVVEYNRFSGHQDVVFGVAVSPDGKMIASGSWDRTIKLWTVDGRLLKTLTGHTDEVNGVVFSPDGKMIASASRDKTIKLWRTDGTLLKTLTGHRGTVETVAFSPDGQLIASASRDKTIKLWRTDGTLLKTLTGHQGVVWGVAFSPDGQTLASASGDKTVKLWTVDGTLLKTLTGHTDDVNSVAFSPDGQLITSTSRDTTLRLWKREGTLLKTLEGHTDWVYQAQFSPDGTRIASASRDKTIKLWRIDGTLITTLAGHRDRVNNVTFTPDSQILISGSWDKTVRLWKPNRPLLTMLNGHEDAVSAVTFNQDRPLIASAGWDKTIKLWTPDGKLLKTLTGHRDGILDVAFSPEGQLIASASRDKTIKLWRTDGTLLKTLTGHTDWVDGVAFSRDGQTLASASWDNTIKLWTRDGTLLKTLTGHTDTVEDVAFSPDGQLIASASQDHTIKLWTREGQLLKTLTGHTDNVHGVAFSPDGQLIASASRDQTVQLWTRNGQFLKTLTGHTDDVNSVAFSPDGQLIASASQDQTVKLWKRDGTLITTLNGHQDGVMAVAFSPNGKSLASASQDRTVLLWNLNQVIDLRHLIRYSCDWVRDYLQHNADVPPQDQHLCDRPPL